MPAEDPLALVGTTVADKYAIESVVGEGGFAIVYRARHLIWQRPVAIKVFKALDDATAENREQMLEGFLREGALLADLSEKTAAICQARDVGMVTLPRGTAVPFMVLEWLEGETLEAVLARERADGVAPRTVAEALQLLGPAAKALALAHEKGIAHRDVKPANIFVLGAPRSREATVKLLDFGIAKVVQDAQKLAGLFNKTAGVATSFTPAYGAPEQFSRTFGPTGPWTDVFAFALVVTEVLAARDPLDGETITQLGYAVMDEKIRPTPRRLGVSVSDAIEAVFVKALAVKIAERYASAGEFWGALESAVVVDGGASAIGPDAAARAAALGKAPTEAAPFSAPRSGRSPAGDVSTDASVTQSAPPSQARGNGRAAAIGFALAGGLVLAIVVGGALTQAGDAGGAGGAGGATSLEDARVAIAPPPRADAAVCPEGMLPIPGGPFFMGTEDGPASEKPHKVKLAPYCIDRLEVSTNAYKKCSDAGECERAPSANQWAKITDHQRSVYDPLCNIRDVGARGSHPINCVDWEMAETFCKVRGARLPTEAEWEFAARGPDGRRFPWGDDAPTGNHLNACGTECVAWAKKHNEPDFVAMYPTDDGFANTAPVGSFPGGKSIYGVEDLVGNVWEWVEDWFDDYAVPPVGAALDDPHGATKGTTRVIRGGAWNSSDATWLRPSFRYMSAPEQRSYGIGFRCARSM